jgi:hypothetical protein
LSFLNQIAASNYYYWNIGHKYNYNSIGSNFGGKVRNLLDDRGHLAELREGTLDDLDGNAGEADET